MTTAPLPPDLLGHVYHSAGGRRPVTSLDLKSCRACGMNLPRAQFRKADRRNGAPMYFPDCIACEAAIAQRKADERPDGRALTEFELALISRDRVSEALRRRKKVRPFLDPDAVATATAMTSWGAAAYTEEALATLDSYQSFFEAFVEVFEERIGTHISPEAREAFMLEVMRRAAAKNIERGTL